MSYHILFEGVCFVLSYPTHIWNAYVADFFLENCVDFYNLVFPGEAKMCLGFMRFRAPPAASTQKN